MSKFVRNSSLRFIPLGCVIALASWGSYAQRAGDPKQTEQTLQTIRQEIQTVTQQKQQLAGAEKSAQQQLKTFDQQINSTSQALLKTESDLKQHTQSLTELQQQRDQQQKLLSQNQTQLAQVLKSMYVMGNTHPLKVLMSQEHDQAKRILGYQKYLQQAQVQQVQTLNTELADLAASEQRLKEVSQKLETGMQQQQQQMTELDKQRQARTQLVQQLQQQQQTQEQRESELARDARNLEAVLVNLRDAAARAEVARRNAPPPAPVQATEKPNNTPTIPNKTKTTASIAAPKVSGARWPVAGELLARYGGKLPEGGTSSGLLIAATEGTPVTAVSDGTVVFSDWMTGYGMILIIDHGQGYMSLYAHNDSLLRPVGAHIKRGDTIAKVGTSGGSQIPALYFELRHNGQPVDPNVWLQRQ